EIAASSASQPDKGLAYQNLLDKIVTSNSDNLIPNLKAFVDAALDESLGTVASRPILDKFSQTTLDQIGDIETRKRIAVYAIEKLEPRVHFFEEQDTVIRDKLARIYEEDEDYLA